LVDCLKEPEVLRGQLNVIMIEIKDHNMRLRDQRIDMLCSGSSVDEITPAE
jgi:hypothetical protein